MLRQCRECACFSVPNSFPREIPRVFPFLRNALTARRLGVDGAPSLLYSFCGRGFSMMRKSLFRSVAKPLPDDGTGFCARRKRLSGAPDTSGRHDGRALAVSQNAFSCPVVMFPPHRGMAFTDMCFNLKLLIVWMIVLLRWSGTDSEETCRTLLARLSGLCGR